MAPIGLHELSRAIGALQADVASLTKTLDKESENAAHHRQALRETIAALSQAVRDLAQKVQDYHPVIEESRQQLAEAKGRAKLGRWLLGLWMALASSIGATVGWALSHWKGVLIPAGIILVLATAALAHDAPSGWAYPPQCCSDRDCAPISCMKLEAMIASGEVKASIVHESQDASCHICTQPYAAVNKHLCAFRPLLTH